MVWFLFVIAIQVWYRCLLVASRNFVFLRMLRIIGV